MADELPPYIHHQISNTYNDNIKHHRIYTKINLTNNNNQQHKNTNNNNNNHHQRHHILSPLDNIALTNPSSLGYNVDTIKNNDDDDDDNIKTFFQQMDISSINDDKQQQHHHINSNNYNDYEVVGHHRINNNDDDGDDDEIGTSISDGMSNSGSSSSSVTSNGIINDDNTGDLYGKRKLRHRGDVQQQQQQQTKQLNGVCPSNIGADDGYTIADKTRQYKLCEPIHKLPQCRFVYLYFKKNPKNIN